MKSSLNLPKQKKHIESKDNSFKKYTYILYKTLYRNVKEFSNWESILKIIQLQLNILHN